MVMKAAFLYAKEDIRLEDVELPEVDAHGLLIRVLACGICGSDSRYYFNGPSSRYLKPIILGHELCGEVVAAGPEADDYFPGDRISVAPIIPCMRCKPCARGEDNLCETSRVIGVNVHGGMAQFMLIPGQMVQVGGAVKIPPQVNTEAAALAELVGCCLHGLRQIGLAAGEQVIILGGGPIGMTFLQLARLMGARVISSEPLERRRKLALELGAEEVIDPGETDLKARYKGRLDHVIIATANLAAAYQALELARPGGQVLFFSGYLPGSSLDLPLNDVHYRELHLHGSIDCTIRDFQKAVSLLPQLQMDRLVTHRFPLERVVAAFQATRDPEAVKVLLQP